MARRSPAPSNSHQRVIHSERALTESRRTKLSGDLERKYFEFDRNIVAGVLGLLQSAVNTGAAQMEMVADERMFDKSLSGTFSRAALHLNQMGQKLGVLLGEVSGATGYPKPALEFAVAHAVVRRHLGRPLRD